MKKRGGNHPAPPTKRCKRCRLFKPNTDEFYKNPEQSKKCLMCVEFKRREYQREYWRAHPEKKREHQSRYGKKWRMIRRIKAVPVGYILMKEAAKKYCYSGGHLRRLAKAGRLRTIKILNRVYVVESDVKAYVTYANSLRPIRIPVCRICGETELSKMKRESRGRIANLCKKCHSNQMRALRISRRNGETNHAA